MRAYVYLPLLVALAAPIAAFSANTVELKKAGASSWTCENQASLDGYQNWFTQKITCLQADVASPYQGYVGTCTSSGNCTSVGQLGAIELRNGHPNNILAISPDGQSNWTILQGIPAKGPAVVTLNAQGKVTVFNPAKCSCFPGPDPVVPNAWSCKTNLGANKNVPGYYVNCSSGAAGN